jgi:hypothetical protein
MDATEFTVGNNSNGKVRVKHIGEINSPKKVLNKKGDNTSGLALFIKYYMRINATGDSIDPVFIMAVRNMQTETFHAYEVKGLGIGTDIASIGHILFCPF